MRCIRSHTSNPFFNLAAEEFLLKSFSDDLYFQYLNSPCVVIGKHQNAQAEIDVKYLAESKILLARRISGGGAVYHDKGNINYSFITNELPGDLIKFEKYTAPVISMLRELGVHAFSGKRNEILTDSGKISGTASHVFKSRVLHHGTLLFDADIEKLARCLYVDSGHYTDRAVKSVRSDVVNIRDLLSSKMSISEFDEYLFRYILSSGEVNSLYSFSASDIESIEELMQKKFLGWEWNYGYSPRYILERDFLEFHIIAKIEKGVIESVEIDGEGWEDWRYTGALTGLTGVRHDRTTIGLLLRQKYKDHQLVEDILDVLF
jgi:lipoate-protein ligase A